MTKTNYLLCGSVMILFGILAEITHYHRILIPIVGVIPFDLIGLVAGLTGLCCLIKGISTGN